MKRTLSTSTERVNRAKIMLFRLYSEVLTQVRQVTANHLLSKFKRRLVYEKNFKHQYRTRKDGSVHLILNERRLKNFLRP